MSALTQETLMQWLEQLDIDFNLCDDCQGLHLNQLQSLDSVLDARIFCFDSHLHFDLELEVRPSGIMKSLAYNASLNQAHPMFKVFLQIDDDALPQMHFSQGLHNFQVTTEQLAAWIQYCISQSHVFINELELLDVLLSEADELEMTQTGSQNIDRFH